MSEDDNTLASDKISCRSESEEYSLFSSKNNMIVIHIFLYFIHYSCYCYYDIDHIRVHMSSHDILSFGRVNKWIAFDGSNPRKMLLQSNMRSSWTCTMSKPCKKLIFFPVLGQGASLSSPSGAHMCAAVSYHIYR